jgi:hypothetical protein
MPTPWLKRIKKSGKLAVFNKATAWSESVDKAMTDFNGLHLGPTLEKAKDEKSANVVILLATGPQHYTYYGDTVSTGSDFTANTLHGETRALIDTSLNAIFFAAVFLPGKAKATKRQREVVVFHELIHACGLVANDDHDVVGVMFGAMQVSGDGLLEYMPEKGAKPMPPIRVGSRTKCKLQMIWADGPACD